MGRIAAVGSGKIWTPSGIQYNDPVFSIFPGDRPPLIASAYDDEFNDKSIDSKWSWLNQGTATIAEADGLEQIISPSAAGNNLRMRVQAAPAGDFTLTAKISAASKLNTNTGRFGIALLAAGATPAMEVFYHRQWNGPFDAGFALERWTNPTTFSASIASNDLNGFFPPAVYLRAKVVGTAITYSLSADGYDFTQYGTSTVTAFIGANRAALTQIGFFACNDGQGQDSQMACHWFRVA